MKKLLLVLLILFLVFTSGCIMDGSSWGGDNSTDDESYQISVDISSNKSKVVIRFYNISISEIRLNQKEYNVNVDKENQRFIIKNPKIDKVNRLMLNISNFSGSNDENQINRKIFHVFPRNKKSISLQFKPIKINDKQALIRKDPSYEFLSVNGENKLISQAYKYSNNIGGELTALIIENHEIQQELSKSLFDKGNQDLDSSEDLGYHVKKFHNLASERNLTKTEFKVLIDTLRANNIFFFRYGGALDKFSGAVFWNSSRWQGYKEVKNTSLRTPIPFVYYSGKGLNPYPVTSISWANNYFQDGYKGKALDILDSQRSYLEKRSFKGIEYGVFRSYFEFQGSDLSWYSSFSQGLGAGAYAMAYNMTGEEKYLKDSKLLFNSFTLPLEENRIVTESKYGTWFLEYSYNQDQLILNGHIITLKGLYYYWQVTGDQRAYDLFESGVKSVKQALPDYDTGNWSKYSNIDGEATEVYHRLHINLLTWLYDRTDDEYFLNYAEKWDQYLKEKGLETEPDR